MQRRDPFARAPLTFETMSPDELRAAVLKKLSGQTQAGREGFIQMLELGMRETGLDLRAYLIPLGFPGTHPENLTPNEVAHLVRYLKLVVPGAMPAVLAALEG